MRRWVGRRTESALIAIGCLAAVLLMAFLVSPATAISAQSSQLVVRIDGLRSGDGVVRLGLFDSADDFPRGRPAIGQAIPAMTGSVVAVFDDVSQGRYAIALYHDEDDNGEFTKNFLGLPLEGFGFSNDAPVGLGPPGFDTAAINVTGTVARTAISTRY